MRSSKRVVAILLTPRSEWPVIAREPADAASLFLGYAAVLAAIPAVCLFLGVTMIGRSTSVGTLHVGLVSGLTGAALTYVLSFVFVFVATWIVAALAPTFAGRRSIGHARKLVVYSLTPAWLAGIFYLVPDFGSLFWLGVVYGSYLLWTGLPTLMRTPQNRAPAYILAVAVSLVVLSGIAWFVLIRPLFRFLY